ncbi:MAG TPA: A/G-specific adenine glycosylase [Rhizomicrobium sp.]|nr:A/G-specific adenine glycosylase [Rhizomicrobium sp.]
MKKPKQGELAARLLTWYDRHRRVLPWRAPPSKGKEGKRADPYRVWLSEIMLQQTTVQAVAGYYRKFLARWPDVEALAAAKEEEVLAAWAGLGYYARARNLHAAAKIVANEMGGKFPATAEGLRALPGVGGYTSGAIAAIAYDERQAAMDANAERVIARLYAVTAPLPKAKAELHALNLALVPERAGDFVQALMDLGAAICTPKRPACGNCPWAEDCVARAQGLQETLPMKAPKRARPLKRGVAFVARDASGAVLLVKRPDRGLLASMLEPPLGAWREGFPSKAQALKEAPFDATWKKRMGLVRHGFTHFELEIEVYFAQLTTHPPLEGRGSGSVPISNARQRVRGGGILPLTEKSDASHPDFSASPSRGEAIREARWVAQDDLAKVALPTVMRKIVAHGLDEGGPLFATRGDVQTSSARSR